MLKNADFSILDLVTFLGILNKYLGFEVICKNYLRMKLEVGLGIVQS